MIIDPTQMRSLSRQWRERLDADVATELRRRFDAMPPDAAAARRFRAVSDADLRRYVGAIADRSVAHGFSARDDLLALIEACLAHDARRLLSTPVIEHPELTPEEKISVMTALALKKPLPASLPADLA